MFLRGRKPFFNFRRACSGVKGNTHDRSIKGSGTRQFVEQGKPRFSGVDVMLAHRRLGQINTAANLQALAGLNSVCLHKLKRDKRDFCSVDVNGPWRIHFRFKEGNADDLNILDPH